MEEYKVSDYGIFNNAINSTSTFTNKITSIQEAMDNSKNQLNNESVFMGPICESCIKGFSTVDGEISTLLSHLGTISNYLNETATAYKNGDSSAMNKVLSSDGENVSVGSGAKVDGNVINTNSPVTSGNQYNLSDDDLAYLAYVAKQEQGSVDGAKLELSLMANLYEKNKSNYSDVKDYVKNSKWFASRSINNYSYPGDDYYNAAKEVLNDGNRYLDNNVVEHDCLSDISSISTGSVGNRSDYIPGETIIKNKMGATYKFIGFAPNDGDPFGYLV